MQIAVRCLGRVLRTLGFAPEHSDRESGQALEHRVVMEKHLGRRLRADESVHHIDGNRSRNAIENLQLRQGSHGKSIAMKCLDCGSHNIGPVPLAESERDKEARRKLNDEPPALF